MAIVNSTVPAPSAIYVPGIGTPGRDGTDGVDGRNGTDGRDGAPGQGIIFTRTAAASIPAWRALVANADGSVIPAAPSDPTHRGRIIGITARGASVGLPASIQNAGDLLGPDGGFTAGTPLFVGANGALVTTPPATGWRQIVATATASGQVVVALGEARVVAEEGTALVVPGGFASAASSADVDQGEATDKFVTPAALDPALSGKLGLAAFLQAAAGYNLPSSNKTILDWLADLMIEGAELRALGFVGDGQSHPLSERFGTGSAGLAAAKAVFPRAVALTEEIDGHAIQRRIDIAVGNGMASCTVLPRGCTALTSFPIDSTATKACHVSSPGPATIKCVGASSGCWNHGTEAAKASGPFTWRGVDLDSASSVPTTLLTTFFGVGGIGRGQCLTVQKARFDRGTRGWLLGDMPRGATIYDLQVFGPDNQMQAGAGIEVKVTNACTYGSFAYSWKDVIVANYTWAWDCSCAQALEAVLFSGCHGYNGWGFCRVNNSRSGFYYSLLWEFNGCDWEGLGFALDMYRCKGVRVRGGFWIQTANNAGRPLPAGVVTDGGELRHVNFRDVNDFMLDGMQFSAGAPSDGSTRTNYVLVHTDTACFAGEITGSSLLTDYATATCAFRMGGSKTGTIVERRTKLLNWWGNPPVVVYAGTGDQPYQISEADAASKGGTVSDSGYYRFKGVGVYTSDAQGRFTIPLPRRSGGVLPFFHETPVAMVTPGNSNGATVGLSIISVTSTVITVVVAGNASGVTLAAYWTVEGF